MNIYEIDFIRSYEDKEPRTSCWQVVAHSEYDACAKIGQMVNNEDTEITIFNVLLVWSGK